MKIALLLMLACGNAYGQAMISLQEMAEDPRAVGRIMEGRRAPSPALRAPSPDGRGRGASPGEGTLEDRRRAIEEIHSVPVVSPRWLPKFIADVPAYRVVQGPTVEKEGFFQRLVRVPFSLAIGAIGGMINVGSQWSKVVGDGGDTFGAVGGAVAGGLFGLVAGILVGAAGTVVNAALAVKNLFTGKF